MKSVSKYLKTNFLVSVSKIFTVTLVTLLLLPLIIKRVGLELYGIVSLTLLFSGVSSLVDLGLSKAVVLLSGENKIPENKVISSAFYINLSIVGILSLAFILLQLFSVDLLGSKLNMAADDKFILLNTGFLLLVLMLMNNLCRTVLEAKLMIHVVNLSLAIYTPLLYLSIYTLSFFTNETIPYIITPLALTLLLFLFNVMYLRIKTSIRIVKVSFSNVKYVLKSSFAFLNIGLVNSLMMPTMRYIFVLMVADVGLYALFDLSFKIAMLANNFITSLAVPMFAVFSKQIKTNKDNMVRIAYNIFYISTLMYVLMLVGYYVLGSNVLSFLNLKTNNLSLLYDTSFTLISALGSVAIVEIFYRYFLGNNDLKKALLLKLIVPFCSIILFFALKEHELIYRFIYAYSISLIISAVVIALAFFIKNNSKQIVKV